MGKSWRESKLEYLKRLYGDVVEDYREHSDDRLVYVNIYNQIVEALNSLPDMSHVYVCKSVGAAIYEDKRVMDCIRERFGD